jgi:formamidopyrimidine-DNA glycosylase
MPELPEVQATVDGIKSYILGRRFKDIWTDWPKILKDSLDQRRIRHNHLRFFKDYLKGEKILNVRRRAKSIIFDLSNDKAMLIHQKMSGHLLLGKWKVVKSKKGQRTSERAVAIAPRVMKTDPWNGYIRLIFYFDRGPMLAFPICDASGR